MVHTDNKIHLTSQKGLPTAFADIMCEEVRLLAQDLMAQGRLPDSKLIESLDRVHEVTGLIVSNLDFFVNKEPHSLSSWCRVGSAEINELFAAVNASTNTNSKTYLPVATNNEDILCLCTKDLRVLDTNSVNLSIKKFDEAMCEAVILHPPSMSHERHFNFIQDFIQQDNREVGAYLERFVLKELLKNPRYQAGVERGDSRRGHPEGTIKAHIEALEKNLAKLKDNGFINDPADEAVLKILIHTHDTFKGEARRGARIHDIDSHASIARAFIEDLWKGRGKEYLGTMLQEHDSPYSAWRASASNIQWAEEKINRVFCEIQDIELFTTFVIIDNIVEGKNPEPVQWFVDHVKARFDFESYFVNDPQNLLDCLNMSRD